MPQPKKQEGPGRIGISRFVKKTSAQAGNTRSDKTYRFVGFFERMKSIDVKLSHSSLNDQNHKFDNLLAKEQGLYMTTYSKNMLDDNDDLSNSNFIELLRTEKFHNRSLEFDAIYRDLENLCFSYPLVIMNRKKIVRRLLYYLTAAHLRVAQCSVLDLIIALLKDLRQDIYTDFLHSILPKIVAVLDRDNLKLLDKVFQLLSFAMKFLIKDIKSDIKNVYTIFFELIGHSNRYVRKFASQSLSFVIRKLPINKELIEMIVEPMGDENSMHGVSDLFFEVLSGQGEDLHSKARSVLAEILKSNCSWELIRMIYLKLVNSIDTSKQLPMFEELTEHLSGDSLLLLFQVCNDCVQLKFGRRIHEITVVHLTQVFQQLLKSDQEFDCQTSVKLAETLGYLFYFKHDYVLNIFSKSKLDFSSTKSVFTNGIYRLAKKDCVPVLKGFFSLLLQTHYDVKPSSDLDIEKILRIKESVRGFTEFNIHGHQSKAGLLVPAFGKNLLKTILPSLEKESVYHIIALFVRMVQVSGRPFALAHFPTATEKILIDSLLEDQNDFKIFTCATFCALLESENELKKTLDTILNASKSVAVPLKFNKDPAFLKDNFVIDRYTLKHEKMYAAIETVIDLNNQPFQEQLFSSARFVIENKPLTPVHASNLYCLRHVQRQPYADQELGEELAHTLFRNLSKNSRELRIKTLEVLKQYQTFQYKDGENAIDKDFETIKTHYTGHCNVLELLYECEKREITLEYEKQKQSLLRKVLTMVGSGMVPDLYKEAVFNYAIGCLWIKFSPMFAPAMEIMQELCRQDQGILELHLSLLENVGILCQVSPEKDVMMGKLLDSLNMKVIDETHLQALLYRESRTHAQDFVQLKDFHYNLAKTMFPIIDLVCSNNAVKGTLFDMYEEFMVVEYLPLHQYQHSNAESSDLKVLMNEANRVDSDDFKQHRKTAYSKLCAFYEIFSKATKLGNLTVQNTQLLVKHLHALINSQDENFQKLALTCLLKVNKKGEGNLTAKYPKYVKLLEGLADDKEYYNMIPIIIHGSEGKDYVAEEQEKEIEEKTKKRAKGTIPKLDQEDRQDVLPLVIKLLFSKMLKRRGAINKKHVKVRKNIVYTFLASLDVKTEFPLFFEELLSPLGLKSDTQPEEFEQKLACVSFGKLLAFVDSLEVIFKQLGILLTEHNYLEKLTKIFIAVLTLAKKFLGHLRITSEAEEQQKQLEGTVVKAVGSTLYVFVEHQCKTCIRKGFKLIKQLYTKFNAQESFIKQLSTQVYTHLIKDQLEHLSSRYIHDKSILVELLCLSWSQYSIQSFLDYPDVLPAVMGMLSARKVEPIVFQYHLTMLKNLVGHSLENKAKQLFNEEMDEGIQQSASDDDDEKMDAVVESKPELARRILTDFSNDFAVHLHAVWSGHEDSLKGALMGKKRTYGVQQSSQVIKTQIVYQAAVKDLVFILSELASYLGEDKEIAHGFLSMIVSMVSTRGLLKMSNNSAGTMTAFFADKAHKNEQLLLFGIQAISNLIKKIIEGEGKIGDELLQKTFEIFLDLASKKAREKLAEGLAPVLSATTVQLTKEMNKVKRGLADIDLDFESVLSAIQKATELESTNHLDIMLVVFNVLYLVQNQEFSVRDYACHAFSDLIQKADRCTFQRCEKQLSDYLRTTADELILKSILATWRHLVIASQKVEYGKEMLSYGMVPLLQPENKDSKEFDDFFSQVLSLQLKIRQKALRKLGKCAEVSTNAFREVLLPLADYIIFASNKQMQNMRHTVRYNREQAQQLREEALNLYVGYCQRLQWWEYFRLIRKLLFKLRKAVKKGNEHAGTKADLAQQKVIVKCICKVLDGFCVKEVPDAVELIEIEAAKKQEAGGKMTDFSKLIAELVASATIVEEEKDEIEGMEVSDHSDDEEEEPLKEEEKMLVDPVEPVHEITDQEKSFVEGIQNRLRVQVLPILQRHLVEGDENKMVRGFVAVSVAKVIRKLPIHSFKAHLHKLVNLIVTEGLRSRDLTCREKARKALVKVVEEVSPRFLGMIFQQMQDLLTRGYQLHVHLYTVHYILQAMNYQKQLENDAFVKIREDACLKPGMITSEMIFLTQELLLKELFGELLEEKQLQDTQKKHIKESKTRKSMAIFEVFAQYIDFKTSFLDLITPIIKILEENPNFSRIQQCEDLLGRISSSLLKNKTLNGQQLLIFVYSIIQRGVSMSKKTKINDEKATRDYGALPEYIKVSDDKKKETTYGIEMKWIKSHQMAGDRKTEEVCGRVLAHFGLQALKKGLKQKGLILSGSEHQNRNSVAINEDKELVERLDPFVPLLLEAFSTYYNPIVVSTLNILLTVVHLGLPSFTTLLKKFLNRILKLFSQTSTDDPDFTNSLFRVASELIRTYSIYNDLSDTQVQTLVLIIKSNLAAFQTQQNVFHCLRAIIYRKFMCADLYDLMEQVQEMMVSSLHKSTRTICANIFVQFLLEYPLEAGRLEQHINHVVKNLGYFQVDGRLQLLEVFDVLLNKLPVQLLDNYTDLFFFTLFLRLINDDSNECRIKVTNCLKKLVKKTSKSRTLMQTVLKIGQNEDADSEKAESMLNGKLQILAVFGEMGTLQKEELKSTVELCSQIVKKYAAKLKLRVNADMAEPKEEENPEAQRFLNAIDLASSEEEDVPEAQDPWSTIYFAILCLENLFKHCEKEQALLLSLVRTLDMGQTLVFMTSKHENYWVRLSTQRLFTHILAASKDVHKTLNLKEGDLLKLVYDFTVSMRYPHLSEELATILTGNLTTLTMLFDSEEELAKIFKKGSYVGRKILGSNLQTEVPLKALLTWYKSIVMAFKENEGLLKPVTGPMLEIVYRTYTDTAMGQTQVHAVSTEIVDTLSTAFTEKSFFITEYNLVQQNITKARQERKQKQKLLAGTEAGAEIKAKKRKVKAKRAKEKKQEKMLRYAMTR